MPPKEKYSDPKLRDEVKEEIQQSDKGGEPGQWSARKAQMMAKEYKKRGGDYNTPKSSKDDSQKNLDKWGEEDWQTKEGSGEAKQDDGSRKRYLPKKAWEQMDEKEKKETDDKKKKASKEGKQFVGNTEKAQQARKEAAEDDDNKSGEDEDRQKKSPGKVQNQSKGKSQQKETQSTERNADDDTEGERSEVSQTSSQKENQSPPQGQKRSRSRSKQPHEDEQDQKKQKTSKSKSTIGSKHDSSDPPAQQGLTSRLPKKGQKNVHWKAMPGWVEGEVVEVVDGDQKVEGQNVKASKDNPKVVLKSKSSGKICVHKADNVYFD